MPYTQTTPTTLAMCSKRGGTERVLHGVKFPEGAVWSYDSASMGRCPDWAGESIFWELDGEPVGTVLTVERAEKVIDNLLGKVVVYGKGEADDRKMTRDEIAERVRPLIGAERVLTLD